MDEYFFFVPLRHPWLDWFKILGVDNVGEVGEEGDDIYD